MALKLFSQMQQSQVQPFVVPCNAAISACGLDHQWAEALRLFFQIRSPRCSLVSSHTVLQ